MAPYHGEFAEDPNAIWNPYITQRTLTIPIVTIDIIIILRTLFVRTMPP